MRGVEAKTGAGARGGTALGAGGGRSSGRDAGSGARGGPTGEKGIAADEKGREAGASYASGMHYFKKRHIRCAEVLGSERPRGLQKGDELPGPVRRLGVIAAPEKFPAHEDLRDRAHPRDG